MVFTLGTRFSSSFQAKTPGRLIEYVRGLSFDLFRWESRASSLERVRRCEFNLEVS